MQISLQQQPRSTTMSSKNVAVFGIYATPGTAEAAVDHLLANGFTNSAISVLLPDDESTRAFAHEKSTKAPEGTATGVATGGVIGGTLGLLAGIGALAIPGVGPLIAAGPIMATLAGVGAGGAVGGVVGALVGMGIPEYEAKRYEGAVKGGGTLLSVHCDTSEQIDAAKKSLQDTGARDISSSSEAGSKDTAGGRGTFGNISDGEKIATATDRDRVIEQEDLVTADRTTTRY
jgi:hypothetical protein